MSADPDVQMLKSFSHRALLMADRLERYRKALEEITAAVTLKEAMRLASEALQDKL